MLPAINPVFFPAENTRRITPQMPVYIFSRMYNHFSSQKWILQLLYVEGAIVTTPYLFDYY